MLGDLANQEKSVLLAGAMGQSIRMELIDDSNKYRIIISGPFKHSWLADRHLTTPWEDILQQERERIVNDPNVLQKCLSANTPDLYHPANMALAWRVLNHFSVDIMDWWESLSPNALLLLSPADAQCLWLDKILSLAIEAGIVEIK